MTSDMWRRDGEEHGHIEVSDLRLELRANGKTDWFFNPADNTRVANVPRVTHDVMERVFSIEAKVSVDFASAYDAAAIFVEVDENNWAKVAFEFSASRQPTIVSVVTRTTSDDSDGPVHKADHVWLRAYCDGSTIAFHYSSDGKTWTFLRWFTIPNAGKRPVRVGVGAQSPTGPGTCARITDLQLKFSEIKNLRNGE